MILYKIHHLLFPQIEDIPGVLTDSDSTADRSDMKALKKVFTLSGSPEMSRDKHTTKKIAREIDSTTTGDSVI
jgi:hypothetical protein